MLRSMLRSMLSALRQHYPEYLMEAGELGVFMIAAGTATTIFEYPASPIHQALPDAFLRRILIGIAMGVTATALIYSPWGKQSGAHFNPAVTLTFFRLGKVKFWDTIFYVLFQFIGGLAGVLLTMFVLRLSFTQLPVHYIVTIPGSAGVWVAFICEIGIAFIMMCMVLYTSNTRGLAPFTGVFSGCLVATYVIVESPLSGFGMNPARTVASALPAGVWTAIWLYFTAPILGMLFAAEVYGRVRGFHRVACAKLIHHHYSNQRCIHCDRHEKIAYRSSRQQRSKC